MIFKESIEHSLYTLKIFLNTNLMIKKLEFSNYSQVNYSCNNCCIRTLNVTCIIGENFYNFTEDVKEEEIKEKYYIYCLKCLFSYLSHTLNAGSDKITIINFYSKEEMLKMVQEFSNLNKRLCSKGKLFC